MGYIRIIGVVIGVTAILLGVFLFVGGIVYWSEGGEWHWWASHAYLVDIAKVGIVLGVATIVFGVVLWAAVIPKKPRKSVEVFTEDTGKCPYCDSSDIEEGMMYSWQRVCKNCGAKWNTGEHRE